MNVYVRNLAESLSSLGLQIDVFTRNHDGEDPREIPMTNQARLIHIDAGPTNAPKEELHQYLPQFLDNLKEYVAANQLDYDVIHSHYWLSSKVGLILAQGWNIPHITTFHTLEMIKRMSRDGEQPIKLRANSEERIANSEGTIIVSHSHEKDFLVHFYSASQDKVVIVPCGVDKRLFRPFNKSKAREILAITHPYVLLHVGRMDPVKGADLLLKAVSIMDRSSEIQILIVGDNSNDHPELQRLKQLASALSLDNQVRFDGVVPQENLHIYYNAADVLVMPSYAESFGLTALEAMSCGIPVVASRVGGLPGLVKEGVTGYLVPWHRPSSFAERLEIILANPSLANEMGKAAIRYSEGKSWEEMARQVLQVYQSISCHELSSQEWEVYEKI